MSLIIQTSRQSRLFRKATAILEKAIDTPDSGFVFVNGWGEYSDDKRTSVITYFGGIHAYIRIPTSFTNPTIEQLKLLIHEEMQVKDE